MRTLYRDQSTILGGMRTVTVELREDELRQIARSVPRYETWVTPDFMQRITTALRQFDADRDRDVKVQMLQTVSDFCTSSACIVTRLNAAGWDLVRIEEND
jgi:hypothetical protein